MEDSLKRTLKTLKEREALISMMLGAVLVLVLGFLGTIYGFKLLNKPIQKSADLVLSEIITLSPTGSARSFLAQITQRPTPSTAVSLPTFPDSNREIGLAVKQTAQTVMDNQGDSLRVTFEQIASKLKRSPAGQITTTSMATSSAEPASQDSQTTYTVTPGDNLWRIAEKFYGTGFKYTEIAEYNNLANPGFLRAGQTLVIPQMALTEANSDLTITSYTVVKGDSLWAIAQKTYGDGYKYHELFRANSQLIKNPNVIEPRWVVIIPRT